MTSYTVMISGSSFSAVETGKFEEVEVDVSVVSCQLEVDRANLVVG